MLDCNPYLCKKKFILRNLFFIIFILIGSLWGAQQLHQEENVFSEPEQREAPNRGPGTGSDGELEGEDVTVSISGYIPLLLLTAFGIIIYTEYKKKKVI